MLDFVRALAVCLVLVDHLAEASKLRDAWWPAQRLGWLGVMLFFVHTSLVLMFSLERTHAASRFACLCQFYLRRAFRIYPLSIAIVVAIMSFHIPVAAWYFQQADTSARTVLANLLLVQNLLDAPSVLGPLWSLPLELQMYLFLPGLFWLVQRGTRRDVAVAVWLLFIALALIQPFITDRANVLQFAPCFSAGVIAYCLWKRSAALPFWLCVVALAAIIFAFMIATADERHAHLMTASWALTFVVGWLIPHFRETRSAAVKRACATIARYSYGIYLTHMIALWVAFVGLGHSGALTRTLAGVSLTVLLPVLAYHLIEAPGIRLGAHLASRLEEVAVADSAAPVHASR